MSIVDFGSRTSDWLQAHRHLTQEAVFDLAMTKLLLSSVVAALLQLSPCYGGDLEVYGWTIASAVDRYGDTDRNLQVLEVFAGKATIHRAAKKRQFTSYAFDIVIKRNDNLLTPSGFERV